MTASAQRVIYVHRTQGEGVEGVHVRGICAGLEQRGYEVREVSPAAGTVPGAITGRRTLKQRLLGLVSSHAPAILFECAELAFNLPAGRRIGALLEAGGVSFIYERYAIFALAAGRLARRSGVPLVLEVNYTARLPLVRRRSRLLRPLARALDRRIFHRATVLLAVSSAVRAHLIDVYGVPAERIVVTPNAADPARFNPATTPIDSIDGRSLSGRQVIGFVGTFAPWHGLDLLLDAFTIVAAQLPQSVLVLVGDGPERAHCAALASSAGLGERVLFSGPVGHEALPRFVARFDVAVLPDTNDYGSPMKIFEYMAMGRPVAAPDRGPVLDVLVDGENAVIFRRRDAASLAARLIELLAAPDRARAIGLAARRTILRERTWLHNVDRMLEALAGARNGAGMAAHA